VKKIFISLAMLAVASLQADADLNSGNYNYYDLAELNQPGAFTFTLSGNAVQNAKFKKWFLDKQKLEYRDAHADITAVFYYEKDCEEGLFAGAGYNNTRLHWKENPFFTESQFHMASVTLGGFTRRAPKWFWQGRVTMNIDTKHSRLSLYANYDTLLWGQYAYSRLVNLHVGFLAQTGMKIERVYPILGFDWQITPSWKLNAVYPVNLSIAYSLNKCWSFLFAGRFFDHRQRVGKNEPLSEGLWAYRASGAELAVNYDCDSWFKANFHIGSTLWTKLTISNKNNEHKRHFKIKSAPYIGGEMFVNF